MFAKRPTQLATELHANLPLHVQNPPVPYLSWSAADSVIRLAATDADTRMWFETSAVYRDATAADAMFQSHTPGEDPTEAKIFNDDIKLLVDSGFAIETKLTRKAFETQHARFNYARLFSVIEVRNGAERRRVIAWPKTLNETESLFKLKLATEHCKARYYTAKEIVDNGLSMHYAASLDFKKFFQQFELLTKTNWCFLYRGLVYLLATIPTGAVFPPLLAHALSRTLLALAVRRANVSHLVRHDCNIDNLRLTSNNLHALWAAWHELLHLCSWINATIGDLNPPPVTSPSPYVYLGMRFSVAGEVSLVELAEKSKKKLLTASSLLRSGQPMLVADVQAIFGNTVWASAVTGYSLGKLFYVIKFIRRIQPKPLHDYVNVWPCITDMWADALTHMMNLENRFTPPGNAKVYMYTDASETGWGVVIVGYTSRAIRVFAGRWSSQEAALHINVLELRAIRIGLRILAQLKSDVERIELQLFVDNTTARAWTLKGRAKQWQANELANHVRDHASRNGILIASVDYVRSHQNPADDPSRRL
jgi:hypothetical protein